MVTKDDAMLAILELEDVLAVLKTKDLSEQVVAAMEERHTALKKYIRNSENIIVPAKD